MRRVRSALTCRMACIVAVLLCGVLKRGRAGELSLWDGSFSPAASTLGTFRARIIRDDIATLDDDLDLDLLNSRHVDSIAKESREIIGNEMEESTQDTACSTRRPLQLALSTAHTKTPRSSSPPLQHSTSKLPTELPSKRSLRSTGTTIVGCLVEQGRYVILGADTRATDDRMVADKDCEKIHCIAPNVWCCGAGTSADLEALTRAAQYSMALSALQETSIGNTLTAIINETLLLQEQGGGIILQPVSVAAACRFLRNELYRANGSLGVNLILGGYDIASNSARLTAIHPHGSMDVVPYAALGSGGLAAMAVLESRYSPNMTKQEGINLVKEAVLAGIENDLGSGSQVDLCVLGPNGSVDYKQGVVPEQELERITKHDESIDDSIMNGSGSSGVNGFGNLPFAVNSRRIIASVQDEATRIEKWNSILGLQ